MPQPAATSAPRPAAAPTLPDALALGPVHLHVSNLDGSVVWYQRSLGLDLHRRTDDTAELGPEDATVVVLHEDPQLVPAARHAGLYHYALLFPERAELARAAVRLAQTRTPIQGASDHGTHEAIYLPDPDGNGIELAADRTRDRWPSFEEEFARGGPQPLDVQDLLTTVDPDEYAARAGDGLRMGHVHLHVGDVEQGLAFYRDVLGFAPQAQLDSAAFVSAGGYHHHLAFNTWRGRGVGPAPAHAAGLRHWTIVLPTRADVDAVRQRVDAAGLPSEPGEAGGFLVRDPWGIAVVVEAAA
jgi:catechol 2,3-dioxygenase